MNKDVYINMLVPDSITNGYGMEGRSLLDENTGWREPIQFRHPNKNAAGLVIQPAAFPSVPDG